MTKFIYLFIYLFIFSGINSFRLNLSLFTPTYNVFVLQEITRLSFKVCFKDSQGISKSHDPVTVDFAIVGGKHLAFSMHLSVHLSVHENWRDKNCNKLREHNSKPGKNYTIL